MSISRSISRSIARAVARPLNSGGVSGVSFDWYVDSANGNDSNDGTSPSQAFATLTPLSSAVSPGESIGLMAGSVWRQALSLSGVDDITLGKYGSGADPRIIGSVVQDLTSAVQPDPVTYPNLWYFEASGVGTSALTYTKLIQDDIAFRRFKVTGTYSDSPADTVASETAALVAVNANTGSFYYKLDGTVQKYWFNSSTNPTSDGKVYEVSWISLVAHGDRWVLRDIELSNSASRDGAFSQNTNEAHRIFNVTMKNNGGLHNFLQTGKYWEWCDVRAYGNKVTSLYHMNSPRSAPKVGYKDCYGANATYAFFNHDNLKDAVAIVDCQTANTSFVSYYVVNAMNPGSSLYIIGHKGNLPSDPLSNVLGSGVVQMNGGQNLYIEDCEFYGGSGLRMSCANFTRIRNSRFYAAVGTSLPYFGTNTPTPDIEFEFCDIYLDMFPLNGGEVNIFSYGRMFNSSPTPTGGSITFKNCNIYWKANNLNTTAAKSPHIVNSSWTALTVDYTTHPNNIWRLAATLTPPPASESDMYSGDPAAGDWALKPGGYSELNDCGYRAGRPSVYRAAAEAILSEVSV